MKTKTQFTNRILSLVLSIMMVVSMLPMNVLTASAAEGDVASVTTAEGTQTYADLASAFAAAAQAENSVLTLLADTATSSSVYVDGGKFTVDLNGKTWTSNGYALAIFGADILITDSTADGQGKIVGTGGYIIMLGDGTKLEIAGGTVENTADFCIDTQYNGHPTDAQFTLSGGKLITAGWAAIKVDCASVTIKGGKIETQGDDEFHGDDHNYYSGLLDFSQHPDPTGIAVINCAGVEIIPGDTTIKLPAGYCFYEQRGNQPVAALPANDYVSCIIGKAPVCTCEEKCSTDSINSACALCSADITACTGGDACSHTGGTATCTEQAKCQRCGASYGELGEHNINNNVCTECGFTYYNLWVGGVQVNSDNAENVLGDGTVSYDADTQTITLSDADISTAALSENVPALKVMNGNITLVLVGENKLTGAENCPGILIESGASVTVSQDSAGSLDVQGQALGYLSQEKIYVNSSIAGDGDFTVSGGTVTGGIHMGGSITITSGTVNADFLAAENVIISGGTVTAAGQAKMCYSDENAPNGTYGIYADNDIQISGGSVTISGGYANITESYVPAIISKASATAAMYAGNAVTVTGGAVTATGGTWNGYSPDDFGFMAFGSSTTVIDEYGKALKASSFTISDEASFTCGDGTPGNHSHSYADAACTSGLICAFCGISGESGTTQHTMDSTTGKCVCGLEMAEASATIGGVTTYYSTLDAAIWAVRYTTEADNAIVKLLMDCEYVNIEGGVFTLNLAGNSLSTENTQSAVLDVTGGTVTVTGGTISGTRKAVEVVGGTLNITEGTTITTTENHTNSKTVEVRDGTLNISGGTITGPVKGVFVRDGTVNITGGTIEPQGNKKSGSVYIEGGTVNISGGSFIDKFALYMEGGTAYVTGGTFQSSNRYALSMLGGTAYVTGGTFTSDGYADISCTNGTVILGMNEESGVGATFPNDLTVSGTTLNAILADGASYWQGEKMIVPGEDQTQITGGDVIIKAACMHENGTPSYAPNADNEYAHDVTWSCCGATVTEEHNFENDTHQCVCGMVETFAVHWSFAEALGLMTGTSTYGQDFVQTITVPENTHLRIEGVYLLEDPSVSVNYTYENGVLTIAATDVPAADVYINCDHNVLVTFHANGGELIPEDGFPQEGSNDIFPEDGSYWTQEWGYGMEICLVNCAEVRREGYTFVDWRDASGQVHQVIPGYGNYTLATEDITLYARWQCNHTIGGVEYRDNGDGTHNGYCGECDELLGNYVERPHDFGDNTHKCVCGKKITPEVTVPTAKTNLIYDGSEQELINAGSTTGGTLQYSLDNVTWSAEIPTAITVGTHTVYYKVVGDENYEDVEAQSIIVTITDKTAPTGTILIKENDWNKFWNTITFGIFCKDYVDVTVTADGTGSGVTKVEYLLSNTVLEENNIPVDGWTTLNADNGSYRFSIQPQSKVAVYVRITDEGGNVTVINSDGIVVYEDSKAVDTEVTYTYKENSNKDIAVEFNGNTVKSIICGEKTLAANSDYTVDYESGKIVLTASYLDALNAGDYTFTVSYNPMGVENSGVTDLTTTFTVKVEPTSIAGATVNVSAIFTYDGNAKTPDPMVVLNGETLVKDRDYTVSYAENVNAGTATVTVTGKCNYSGTASGNFAIGRAELTDVSVQQNGKLTYNGQAQTPTVSTSVTTVDGSKVTFTYGTEMEGLYSAEIPSFTNVGWAHTVYYRATADNHNTYYGIFLVEIEKATVTEPTIATKPYTGSEQTADVTGTDLYTVVKNEGGTGVKENSCYDVVLELKDPANYKWSTTDNAQVTLQFKITRAENEWTVDSSITGWTYGEATKAPVGEAKFGEVSVEYSGTTNGGAAYNGVAAPTEAGSYTATFIVQETEDYKGLETSVDFTIAKADYNMRGAKWNYREPFKYDGKEHKVEVVGLPTGVTAESYENNTATAVGDYYAEVNLTYDAHNYNPPTISKLGWTIYNDWSPTEYTATTPNGNGWLNSDFVITANDGHKVSLTNTADGDWKDALTYSGETADGSVTFYLKNETDGTISLAKTVTYKLDKTAPTGKVEFVNRNAWEEFVNTITFGLFFKDEVTVKAMANDTLSGVDIIEYASADKAMTLDEVKAITDWTEYTDSFGVTLEDTKTFVYFVRITDKAGNVTYLSTDGAGYDTTAPVIDGVENGKTYYTTQKVTVTEKNVDTITLNGNPATENITLAGNKEATYTIVATDKAGNTTTVTVTMKPIKALASATENLGNDNVTSDDAPALEELVETLDALLADEDVSDGERETLEQHKHIAESLIDTINDAAEATDTENTEKVENLTPENVTPENKTDLEGAKADLEKALEDNGGNYTEDEKQAIEDEIKRINEALEVIGNVEAVEEVISKLPAVDTVKPDDEEAFKAITDAQTAYDALSDYEKSLVNEATKAALDKLAAALVAYDIVEGDGSSWTEDSDHSITFVVNGLFSKFVGIKIDGKDVDKANYEVKAGSTIITLKASYLDTLAVGEHTITVVYTDGSTDGTFNVHAKANSPATGDDFNIALYGSLMAVSVTALVVLLLASKKRKQVK